jgi:hypothetical protein
MCDSRQKTHRYRKYGIISILIVSILMILYAAITYSAISYEVNSRADGYEPSVASLWIENFTSYEIASNYHGALASETIPYDEKCRDAISRISLYWGEQIVFSRNERCFYIVGATPNRVDVIIDDIREQINEAFFIN